MAALTDPVFRDTASDAATAAAVNAASALPDPAAPFVGQVWRTVIDTFVGQLSFVRVISGRLAKGELHNSTANGKELAGALVQDVVTHLSDATAKPAQVASAVHQALAEREAV